jgi:hypothetical protein
MKLAKIGSIGRNLKTAEDLLVEFSNALELLATANEHTSQYENHRELVDEARGYAEIGLTNWTADEDEEVTAILADLEEALQFYAPEYTSFGACRADPTDYGFWVMWNILDDDAVGSDPTVLKVDASSEWPDLTEGVEYVLEVNDHGNCALFSASSRKEIWSCV